MITTPPIASAFLNELYAHLTSHEVLFLLAVHESTEPGGHILQHILINRLNHTSPDGLRAVSLRLGDKGYLHRQKIPPVKGQLGRPAVEVTLTDKARALILAARRAS